MAVDKKVKAGVINLVLLNAIGNALVSSEYDRELLKQTLSQHPKLALPA